MVGPGTIQAAPGAEGAGGGERPGLAILKPRPADPARRSGFHEALTQIQERRQRQEAAARPHGLEERPRPDGADASPEAPQDSGQEGRTKAAADRKRSPQAASGDRSDKAATPAEAVAGEAEATGQDDGAAAEAAKAAGVAQVVQTQTQLQPGGAGAVSEADEGEGSAWARFLERAGAAARQSGGEETLEFGARPEQPQLQAAPPEADVALNPMDLLDVHEALDPDLQAEPTPGQLLNRLQQAMQTTPNAALLDEAGEVVLPQVVRGLVALVRDGASEMRLQLQPADLGQIELRVRAMEGVVRGEITVQNQEVRHLLESQLSRLRTALSEQGLDLQDFDVGVAYDGRFSQPDSGGRETAGDGGAAWRRGHRGGGEPVAAAQPTPTEATGQAVADSGDHAVNYVI